jgi:hypothetical protein
MLSSGSSTPVLSGTCFRSTTRTTRRCLVASKDWCRNDVLRNVLTDLANTLRDEGIIDERESFIDATFPSAKGGAEGIGSTKRAKGVKIMGIVDRNGRAPRGQHTCRESS